MREWVQQFVDDWNGGWADWSVGFIAGLNIGLPLWFLTIALDALTYRGRHPVTVNLLEIAIGYAFGRWHQWARQRHRASASK